MSDLKNKKGELMVKDTPIRIKNGYFSLTDIAKNIAERKPNQVIRDWLKNTNTLLFLEAWETVNSSKDVQMDIFKLEAMRNDRKITIARYCELGGTGIFYSSGRYGGTYAHIEIALEFTSWLNPMFKAFFFKEWVRMKTIEVGKQNLNWHVHMLGRNVEEMANLLETLKDGIDEIED